MYRVPALRIFTGQMNILNQNKIKRNAPCLCIYLRLFFQTANSSIEHIDQPSIHDVTIFVDPCKENLTMDWKEDVPQEFWDIELSYMAALSVRNFCASSAIPTSDYTSILWSHPPII